MKKYNPLYYLLFILLVMGAFASMAQNSYGLKIIGGVAFAFGLLFLIQLLNEARKKEEKDFSAIFELTALFLLSVLLGIRVLYIHFPYAEWMFAAAGILLMLIYLMKMLNRYQEFESKNKLLAVLLTIFYLSIILFIISLVLAPFLPVFSSAAGMVAFVIILVFIVAGALKKDMIADGENISAFSVVRKFKDHSIVIVTLFLIFSLYIGFNKTGLIPGIYSDEFPQSYYKLVDDAATGKEKTADGKLKHEDFMEQYQLLLKHIKNEGK